MAIDWRARPDWRSWRTWAWIFGVPLVGALALFALAVALVLPSLPALDKVTDYRPRQPLTVLTRDGEEIAQFGAERRIYLPLAQVPEPLQQAVLAIEDQRFYDHGGIDLRGVARALAAKLGGGRWQGASTITQQVARNFFLSHRRTAERKFKEALLALRIEGVLSKDQILELYLNQIYLGQRAYGFGAAAQIYFGKPLAELSLAEHALLAGLPKNPNYANPVVNLPRAQQRQRLVLAAMRDQGRITPAEHDAARDAPMNIRTAVAVDVHAEHVAEMARRQVVERFGEAAYTGGYKVHTSIVAAEQEAAWAGVRRALLAHERRQPWRGPEAQEALPAPGEPDDEDADGDGDPAEQERAAAARALKDHRDDDDLRVAIVLAASPKAVLLQLASGERLEVTGTGLRLVQRGLSAKAPPALALRRGAIVRLRQEVGKGGKPGQWAFAQWPGAEGAYVALEPTTGRVRALVGGFDFSRQPFNHATQAWRQPGSAFKPFLYSAALEHAVMPATLIADAPLALPDETGPTGWQPQNSDGDFDGPITLRQALARSKNTVSIRLLQQVGVGTVREWAGRFGLEPARQPDNLTLALGAGATTPLQMAAAYAVFANGGLSVTPQVVERVTDAAGKVVYEAAPPPADPQAQRVLPERNAFVMRRLLNEVVTSGTAARARQGLPRADLFGKTGTTNDAVDAWFAGFQPGLVGVAWVGYDEPRSLGSRESGGGLALPIWVDAMKVALAKVPVAKDPPPDGVAQVGDEWVYAEWAEGGAIASIGLDDLGEPLFWPDDDRPANDASGALLPQAGPGPAGGVPLPAPATPAVPTTPAPEPVPLTAPQPLGAPPPPGWARPPPAPASAVPRP
jgi:penicillin-binding protein 1A